MKSIELWLKDTSDPILYNALSTYTKGFFFCIRDNNNKVHKYPIMNIFRVVEDYDQAEVAAKKFAK